MDGRLVRKQKCIKLADVSDRYRRQSDLDDLVAERMGNVRAASKCPHSADSFSAYFENVYLSFVQRTMAVSTYSGYKTYWERCLKPRTGKYALREFTVSVVSELLEDAARCHSLNSETVGKIRSILSGVFTYAMGKGHFAGKSAADNPASRALIPESAIEPKPTVAATREEGQAFLEALKGMPLVRAAVAIIAMLGVRPSEARGLRWEEVDEDNEHIHVKRAVWHKHVGDTKTAKSERFITVSPELREILLDLWKEQNRPMKATSWPAATDSQSF